MNNILFDQKKSNKRYVLPTFFVVGILFVGLVGYFGFINKTHGEGGWTFQSPTSLFGTWNPGTGATTSVKTTADFNDTCVDRGTGRIGQVNNGISFIPYEDGTSLEWRIFSSPDDVHYYQRMVQTNNTTGTSTLNFQTYEFNLDNDGAALTGSSTYRIELPTDQGMQWQRVCIKENGVTSSFGDIFGQQVISAVNE